MRQITLIGILALLTASCGGGGIDKLVTIKTEMGDMTVLLYDETPIHKQNFIALAESGKYDSTIFHRVIQDFMVQGGDMYLNQGGMEPDGDRLPAEIVDGFYHTKGALAAARQGDQINPEKKSSSCQFYIVDGEPWESMSTDKNALFAKLDELLVDSLNNAELFARFDVFRQNGDRTGYYNWGLSLKDSIEQTFNLDLTVLPRTANNQAYEAAGAGSPHLDGEYTVFGRVVEGLDVIDKLAAVPVGPGARPFSNMYLSMSVKTLSKSEITEKYGYEYPE